MKPALIGAISLLAAGAARAAIVFTPHVSEYAELPRGTYGDETLVYSSIDKIFDADGRRVPLGEGAIPPGDSIDALLVLSRWVWIGNLFEDTHIPILSSHDQVYRAVVVGGHEQGDGAIPGLSREFGQRSGGSGLGDLFLLAGVYGEKYRWGPLHGNGLYAFTVKLPVGEYDRRSLLNIGTNYWSFIPQYAFHQDWFGRLSLDATAALQINGRNDKPAYGGLTPTDPADVLNLEGNLSFKFSNRWYLEAGLSWYRSLGANRYDQVTLNFQDQPVPPTTACNTLMVPAAQCNLARAFYLQPVPGAYRDRGLSDTLVTAGLSYIYRASTVLSLRAAIPVAGRGGQIGVPYNVYAAPPDGPAPAPPVSTLPATLTNVQEAGSVSASPYYELRLVFLLFAP